jgi:mannose-6-phosphate isomerase-like protein (cupin superfamily)
VSARIRYTGEFRWEGVPLEEYKPADAHFRDVSRQVLFGGEGSRELRYFEVRPGGFTTLERHRHVHQVMTLRGQGRALVGEEILELRPYDLVRVPPLTWHQFHAGADAPLGFLCLVDRERDRPERPSEADLAALRRTPAVAALIRGRS